MQTTVLEVRYACQGRPSDFIRHSHYAVSAVRSFWQRHTLHYNSRVSLVCIKQNFDDDLEFKPLTL